jgi:hypothetical protein
VKNAIILKRIWTNATVHMNLAAARDFAANA